MRALRGRFNTVETAELKLPAVVKGDGRREPFDLDKLRRSMERALHKRPVPQEQIDAAVRAVVQQARAAGERELASRRLGDFVIEQMRRLDHVGYVRFASVYRAFEDVADFREEIEMLERDMPGGEAQLPAAGRRGAVLRQGCGQGSQALGMAGRQSLLAGIGLVGAVPAAILPGFSSRRSRRCTAPPVPGCRR